MSSTLISILTLISTAIIQFSNTPIFPDNYAFLDVFRNVHEMETNRDIGPNPYKEDCYTYYDTDNQGVKIAEDINPAKLYSYNENDHTSQTLGYTGFIKYEDEFYTSILGVDVSKFQKSIDWKKVKASGIDFAIVRVAYRGYGSAGSLNEDEYYRKNIEGATNAGLDVGVYIYSQAINEEEALQEADYICGLISEYDISLPVVYDPEHVTNDKARTDDVTSEQFTKNARAFCNRVRENGYEPMIYANMLWEAYELDLSVLNDIPLWYADYENLPQSPYKFTMWQYTQAGRVSGIKGNVDLNVMYIQK